MILDIKSNKDYYIIKYEDGTEFCKVKKSNNIEVVKTDFEIEEIED